MTDCRVKTSTRVGRERGGLSSLGWKAPYLEESDPAEELGRSSDAEDSS